MFENRTPTDKHQGKICVDSFQDMVNRHNDTTDGINVKRADNSASSKSTSSDTSFESLSSVDITFKPIKKSNSMSFFDTLDTSIYPRRSSSTNGDELEHEHHGGIKHVATMKCQSDHGISTTGRLWNGKKSIFYKPKQG